MKIIVLTGEGECGKSTTLNIVHAKLVSLGIKMYDVCTLGNPVQRDFYERFNYQGKSIAIYTMGDPSVKEFDKLENAIARCQDANRDVLICACNTQNTSAKDAIDKFEHKSIIEKTPDTNLVSNFEANCLDAARILLALDECVSTRSV